MEHFGKRKPRSRMQGITRALAIGVRGVHSTTCSCFHGRSCTTLIRYIYLTSLHPRNTNIRRICELFYYEISAPRLFAFKLYGKSGYMALSSPIRCIYSTLLLAPICPFLAAENVLCTLWADAYR